MAPPHCPVLRGPGLGGLQERIQGCLAIVVPSGEWASTLAAWSSHRSMHRGPHTGIGTPSPVSRWWRWTGGRHLGRKIYHKVCWLTHFIFNKIIFNNIFFTHQILLLESPFYSLVFRFCFFLTSFQAHHFSKILETESFFFFLTGISWQTGCDPLFKHSCS